MAGDLRGGLHGGPKRGDRRDNTEENRKGEELRRRLLPPRKKKSWFAFGPFGKNVREGGVPKSTGRRTHRRRA